MKSSARHLAVVFLVFRQWRTSWSCFCSFCCPALRYSEISQRSPLTSFSGPTLSNKSRELLLSGEESLWEGRGDWWSLRLREIRPGQASPSVCGRLCLRQTRGRSRVLLPRGRSCWGSRCCLWGSVLILIFPFSKFFVPSTISSVFNSSTVCNVFYTATFCNVFNTCALGSVFNIFNFSSALNNSWDLYIFRKKVPERKATKPN